MLKRSRYFMAFAAIFILSLTLILAACNPNPGRRPSGSDQGDGEWVVEREATCEEDGLRSKIQDGVRVEEAIPALGHDFGEWTVTVQPTHTSDGSRTRACKRCDKVETETVSALVDGTQGLEYRLVDRDEEGEVYYVEGPGSAKDVTELVIPSAYKGKRVYAISRDALVQMPNLERVRFAENSTLVYLFYFAFTDCKNLKEVIDIPATVTYMDADTFSGCDSLEKITMSPQNKTYKIEDGVVYTADMTTLAVYPNGKAGEYNMPDSVTTLEYKSVFPLSYTRNVTAVNVSDAHAKFMSVNGILYEKKAYSSAPTPNGLVWYPSGITEEEFVVPFDNIWIGKSAFDNNRHVKKFIFPKPYAFESIRKYAFRKSAVEWVEIGGKSPWVVSYAFRDCVNLKGVKFEANCEATLQRYAFYGCTALTDVTLPYKMDTDHVLGGGAFAGCTALREFKIAEAGADGATIKLVDGGVVSIDGSMLFEFPNGADRYVVPEGVVDIKHGCMYRYGSPEKLQITDSGDIYLDGWLVGTAADEGDTVTVKSDTVGIAGNVFSSAECDVVLPAGIKYFSESSFEYFEGSVNLSAVENPLYFSNWSFAYANLPDVLDLGTPVFIAEDAFDHAKGITSLTVGTLNNGHRTHIQDGVHGMEGAFSNISTLKVIHIGKYVEYVGDYTFNDLDFDDIWIESYDYVNSDNFSGFHNKLVPNLYFADSITVEDEYARVWQYGEHWAITTVDGVRKCSNIYIGGLLDYRLLDERVTKNGVSYKHFILDREGVPCPGNTPDCPK